MQPRAVLEELVVELDSDHLPEGDKCLPAPRRLAAWFIVKKICMTMTACEKVSFLDEEKHFVTGGTSLRSLHISFINDTFNDSRQTLIARHKLRSDIRYGCVPTSKSRELGELFLTAAERVI